MTVIIKVTAKDQMELIEWLMLKYGGENYNGAWDFPQLPLMADLNMDPLIPFEDQLPLIEFPIHEEELAVMIKLTWAHIIVP